MAESKYLCLQRGLCPARHWQSLRIQLPAPARHGLADQSRAKATHQSHPSEEAARLGVCIAFKSQTWLSLHPVPTPKASPSRRRIWRRWGLAPAPAHHRAEEQPGSQPGPHPSGHPCASPLAVARCGAQHHTERAGSLCAVQPRSHLGTGTGNLAPPVPRRRSRGAREKAALCGGSWALAQHRKHRSPGDTSCISPGNDSSLEHWVLIP